MTPIALFPSDANLIKGAGIGALNIFIGFQFLTWIPNGSILIPSAFAIGGLFLIGQSALAKLKPKPSFAADADGFSIMGKKKLDWDKYRGIQINTVRIGFFPVMRTVVIKTGKSVLGRKMHIKSTHLSASAKAMAKDIEAYARHAQRKIDLNEALAQMPQTDVAQHDDRQRGEPQPITQDTFGSPHEVRLPHADASAGPVRSVPSLGERLFGRSKVI